MLESVLNLENALRRLPQHDGMRRWVVGRGKKQQKVVKRTLKVMQSEHFWSCAHELANLLRPLMLKLRRYDTPDARVPWVYEEILQMRAELAKVSCRSLCTPDSGAMFSVNDSDDEDEVDEKAAAFTSTVLGIVDKRRLEFTTDAHYIGRVLNPQYVAQFKPIPDEVLQRFSTALLKVLVDEKLWSDALAETADWVRGLGPLKVTSENARKRAITMEPHVWWQLFGTTTEILWLMEPLEMFGKS